MSDCGRFNSTTGKQSWTHPITAEERKEHPGSNDGDSDIADQSGTEVCSSSANAGFDEKLLIYTCLMSQVDGNDTQCVIFVLFISTHLVSTRPAPICRSKTELNLVECCSLIRCAPVLTAECLCL